MPGAAARAKAKNEVGLRRRIPLIRTSMRGGAVASRADRGRGGSTWRGPPLLFFSTECKVRLGAVADDETRTQRADRMSLDVRLHVLRRHQSHFVAKRAQLPPPVVRRRARLQVTRQGGSRLKNARTCARRSCLRRTVAPSASPPST